MNAPRRFKPYPAYKDSGVEWLGEIPAHWEVRRLKRVFRVVNGSTPASGEPAYWDGEIPWVTPEDLGDLNAATITSTRRSITEEGYRSCGTTLVPAGSLVLSTRAPIGHLAIAGVDLCTNQGCRSLVFRNAASREFCYYELVAARPELESLGQGSTFRELAKEMLEDVKITVPPEPEQRAIAAFLDRETARIDALVAKNERLIGLLLEKRTALITRAVTKGLPSTGSGQATPPVPMKDSGVEWLGEIPAHWEVKKWRYCCRVTEGQVAPDDERFRERILIAPNHIESGTGRILYTETADEQGAISGKYLVEPGNIIYSKIRPALNKVCIAGGHWLCSADMYPVAITEQRLGAKFLLYFMLSEPFVRLMVDESMRVAMPKVNREKLAACPLIIPSPDEQRAIAAFLDRETARIDAMVAKVREAIERLKEYRTALISAAVTGKIDVRPLVTPAKAGVQEAAE